MNIMQMPSISDSAFFGLFILTFLNHLTGSIEKGLSQSVARMALQDVLGGLIDVGWQGADEALKSYVKTHYGNAPESDWRNDWAVTAFRNCDVEWIQ